MRTRTPRASGCPPLLTREVVERVEQGALTIYAVRRFEQALELAFDRPLEEIDAVLEIDLRAAATPAAAAATRVPAAPLSVGRYDGPVT